MRVPAASPFYRDGPPPAITGVNERERRMFVQTRVARKVSFVLCLSMLALQNGCSNSGSGQAEAPASNANAIGLALSTTSGSRAVVADGRSTIPIRIQITGGSGAGMGGVPVTFATTAGGLSESPVVRSTEPYHVSGGSASATRADSNGRVTVTTDTNGVAQVLLTASTTAGTAVVTADAMGFRTHIDILFVPGPVARVQLNASPSTVNAEWHLDAYRHCDGRQQQSCSW